MSVVQLGVESQLSCHVSRTPSVTVLNTVCSTILKLCPKPTMKKKSFHSFHKTLTGIRGTMSPSVLPVCHFLSPVSSFSPSPFLPPQPLLRLPSWWLRAALSALSVTISGRCVYCRYACACARVQHGCIKPLSWVSAERGHILIQSHTHTHTHSENEIKLC